MSDRNELTHTHTHTCLFIPPSVASSLEHRLRQNDTVYAMVFLERCHTPRTLTHSQPRTVVPILSSTECITKHLEQHGQELKLISDTLLT